MPAALQMQDEYEDAVQVVLVEVGRTTPEEMYAFAIDRGWFDPLTAAMWTKERPLRTSARGIPSYALLDASGEVLLTGLSQRDKGRIEDTVEAHAKGRTKARKDLPKSVAKQLAEFAKGKQGKALAALAALTGEGSRASEEEVIHARQSLPTLNASVERALARVDWLIDHGEYTAAEEELAAMTKRLKGAEAWKSPLAERERRLAADDLKDERKAEQALLKLQKKLYAGGTDKVSVKALHALGEKYPNTLAAARAQQLIPVVEGD